MIKVLTLYDLFLEPLDGSRHKFVRKGTVLELINCEYDYIRKCSSYFVTHWKIVIKLEGEVFFSEPFIEHELDAPMEKRRPFVYLEN